MSDLVARVTQAITMALILAVDEDCRACALTDEERAELARAAIAVCMEEAADAVCEIGDCAEAQAYMNAIRALKDKA